MKKSKGNIRPSRQISRDKLGRNKPVEPRETERVVCRGLVTIYEGSGNRGGGGVSGTWNIVHYSPFAEPGYVRGYRI
jgi:hypothetical protein